MRKKESNPKFESAVSPKFEEKEGGKRAGRSAEEVRMLKERMHFVARVLSDNFNLKLMPGNGWAAGLSKKFEEERRKHPEKSLEDFDESLLMPEIMTYP